jgi:hypothetical protein
MLSLLVSLRNTSGEWKYINNFTPHFILNISEAAIIFYLFYFYFIRYFEQKQFLRYLTYSVLSSIGITLVILPLHRLFNPHFNLIDLRYWLTPMAGTFIIAQCGSLVKGFENWFSDIQVKAELETRNLKNELELLKSQINPHFLFNALNNIDALIRTNPETASDSLVTLSGMLRYMIYETRCDLVPLEKELDYIKSYIRLQQLRHSEPEYIQCILPENSFDIQVAPMILIPFIENAFKYAYNSGKLPVVSISLNCENEVLHFSCSNYCGSFLSEHGPCSGVGLDNTRRRLNLLYPQKHELSIFEKDLSFNVILSIRLT